MRVVIAEDLALLRDGMVRLLEANGFEVVAAVDNADALVHEVKLEKPDVAIVDIRLPPTFRDEGLRAALELRRTSPGTAILVVSQPVAPRARAASRWVFGTASRTSRPTVATNGTVMTERIRPAASIPTP